MPRLLRLALCFWFAAWNNMRQRGAFVSNCKMSFFRAGEKLEKRTTDEREGLRLVYRRARAVFLRVARLCCRSCLPGLVWTNLSRCRTPRRSVISLLGRVSRPFGVGRGGEKGLSGPDQGGVVRRFWFVASRVRQVESYFYFYIYLR